MAHEQVRISDLKPNPFRDMERYPIQERKIEQLIQSYKETNFWGNIVGRKCGAKKVEIAYGHHRLEALKRHPGLKQSSKVSIIIEDLDDERMLKIMANENMEEWTTSAEVVQETIRAVVQAYAEGRIELERPKKPTNTRKLRYAPGFIMGEAPKGGEEHPYTAETVSKFLGWDINNKVSPFLQILARQEEEIFPKDLGDGLSTKQSRAISKNVDKVQKAYESNAEDSEIEADNAEEAGNEKRAKACRAEAKKQRANGKKAAKGAAKKAKQKLKTGEANTKDIPEIVRGYTPPVSKAPPDIGKVTKQVTKTLNKVLSDNKTTQKLEEIIKWKQQLDGEVQKELYQALKGIGERAAKLANEVNKQINSESSTKQLKGAN